MTNQKWNWGALTDQAMAFAISRPEGFTKHDLGEHLQVSPEIVNGIIHRLRRRQAGDSINLVGDPQGWHEPHRFRLVGTREDGIAWLTRWLTDSGTRLVTARSVTNSWGNADTDQGRRARRAARHIDGLVEDLHDLMETA